MELFLMYLWLKLDAILTVMFFLTIPLGVIAFVISMYIHTAGSTLSKEEQYASLKVRNRLIYGMIFCAALALFVPTSKQIAVLVGTNYALELARSPEGAKISQLIRKKANDFLDEQLKETK